MVWRWQSTCSACTYVSAQLGSPTPCPSHAGQWTAPEPEVEPAPATPLPTADCPWPFTPLEYARLLVLRSRIQARHPERCVGEAAD